MIRRARLDEDLPALLEMGRKFLTETVYAGKIAFRPERVEHLYRFLVDRPDRLLLVNVTREGVITGMTGFLTYPHPISGEQVAAEVFWWSESGTGLDLLRAAEAWARSVGAEIIQMIAPQGTQVGRIYQRFGYGPVETLWQRRLE